MQYLNMNIANRMAVLVALVLGLGSCQTPTETPPTTLRKVTVNVQDANGKSMELIPVEMHELEKGQTQLLESQVTDGQGNARFETDIPTTGRAFRFIIGNATTGKMSVDANLLCRDTVLVARLATELLPCGETVTKLLRIEDLCAPLITGERFTDSTQYTFTSTCDEVLTFTLTGPVNEELKLVILDPDGEVITDRPFTIPAKGQFVVRAVATPADSGLQSTSFVFSGSGPNQVSATLNLDVDVDARNCNICECPEETIVVEFGQVEAHPEIGTGTRTIDLPRNLCNFVREDNMIKAASKPANFGVPPIEKEMLVPGSGYSRTYTFVPDPGNYDIVEDTILIEHWIAAESKACTTMVILRGQGCGPQCELVQTAFTETGENMWDYSIGRVRVYESGDGEICVRNIGECGTLNVSETHDSTAGFSLVPSELSISPGGSGCFAVSFDATDEVVWPNGHGQPAKIDHALPVQVIDCGELKTVTVKVRVDTLPAQFSRCIYQWDQNGHYGYNFTPVEGKGEDHYDNDLLNNQDSDIAVVSVVTGLTANVQIKGKWKFIKAGVSETQFNFDDMSKALNGWTRAEYRSITTGPFNSAGAANLMFRSVYSIEVVRGAARFYACIRVREISVDPDGKYKMCLDVLFPMIKE